MNFYLFYVHYRTLSLSTTLPKIYDFTVILLLWGIFGCWDKQKNGSPFEGCLRILVCLGVVIIHKLSYCCVSCFYRV